MKWLDKLTMSKDKRAVLKVAKNVFNDICHGETSAAEVYRDNPSAKAEHWESIDQNLSQLLKPIDIHEVTQGLRGRFAQMVEVLVTDHFYTNLEPQDREYYANYIGSTSEVEDRNYYFSLAHDYAYATILEYIIFNGWEGSEASISHLKELQTNYIDSCQDTCKLTLKLSKAKAQGQEITKEEKESGRTTMMLKEALRRGLAGEKVFDE